MALLIRVAVHTLSSADEYMEKHIVWDVFGKSPRGACGAFAICGIAEDLGHEQTLLKGCHAIRAKLLDLEQEPRQDGS